LRDDNFGDETGYADEFDSTKLMQLSLKGNSPPAEKLNGKAQWNSSKADGEMHLGCCE
jgi:hypothetical protein